jgi:hypothetical protein
LNASSQNQISAATALAQLLTEHPDLSEFISWSIPRYNPRAYGIIHDGGLPVLAACATYIGGTIVPDGKPYENRGRQVQRHVLETTWRDAPVEIVALVPVAAEAVAA